MFRKVKRIKNFNNEITKRNEIKASQGNVKHEVLK